MRNSSFLLSIMAALAVIGLGTYLVYQPSPFSITESTPMREAVTVDPATTITNAVTGENAESTSVTTPGQQGGALQPPAVVSPFDVVVENEADTDTDNPLLPKNDAYRDVEVPQSYPVTDAAKYFIPRNQRSPGNLGGPPPLDFPGGPSDPDRARTIDEGSFAPPPAPGQ